MLGLISAMLVGTLVTPARASSPHYGRGSDPGFALIVGSIVPQNGPYFPVKLVWSAVKPAPKSYRVTMTDELWTDDCCVDDVLFTVNTAKTTLYFDPNLYSIPDNSGDEFSFTVTPIYADGHSGHTLTSGGGWGGTMGIGQAGPRSGQFGPGWKTARSGNYVNGSNNFTTVKNAYATLNWRDGTTNFGLIASKGPKGGLMAVYLAGKKVATINLYAAKTQNRVLVWASNQGNTNLYSSHSRAIRVVNVSKSKTRNQINLNSTETLYCAGTPLCGG
jgi:hypothetical protein